MKHEHGARRAGRPVHSSTYVLIASLAWLCRRVVHSVLLRQMIITVMIVLMLMIMQHGSGIVTVRERVGVSGRPCSNSFWRCT
jgi:hypothetical protein